LTLARDRRSLWIFLIVGAVIGLCVGILVSVPTDVHFAPEIGIVLGLAAGWGRASAADLAGSGDALRVAGALTWRAPT
jgi:hypothetical protein